MRYADAHPLRKSKTTDVGSRCGRRFAGELEQLRRVCGCSNSVGAAGSVAQRRAIRGRCLQRSGTDERAMTSFACKRVSGARQPHARRECAQLQLKSAPAAAAGADTRTKP